MALLHLEEQNLKTVSSQCLFFLLFILQKPNSLCTLIKKMVVLYVLQQFGFNGKNMSPV